ncbi:hypothetical protein lerEdw1_019732 [Lerista edwardsae]|nr:hypothetical protein lerEdw1_019732 [Lerista edwardsae]
MAAVQQISNSIFRLVAFALLQAAPSFAQSRCAGPQDCSQPGTSWTSLWYVWLILLTVFMLLMCGIGASCVKFCCRTKRPPAQPFPPHVHDLTVIPMDHDSTAHSTVTSYSSVQFPQNFLHPLSFREPDRNLGSPPAYSLYAIEMPPSYEEAIKMAKPCTKTLAVGQEVQENSSQPAAPEDHSQPSTLHEIPDSCPESVHPEPGLPEVSAQEQPQP